MTAKADDDRPNAYAPFQADFCWRYFSSLPGFTLLSPFSIAAELAADELIAIPVENPLVQNQRRHRADQAACVFGILGYRMEISLSS